MKDEKEKIVYLNFEVSCIPTLEVRFPNGFIGWEIPTNARLAKYVEKEIKGIFDSLGVEVSGIGKKLKVRVHPKSDTGFLTAEERKLKRKKELEKLLKDIDKYNDEHPDIKG